MNQPLRVLICRSDVLGDNVYSLPVAADLKAALPEVRISWIARSHIAPLIRMDRNVDEVMEWDGNTDPSPLLPLIAKRFDAVVVMHPKPKYWSPLAALLRRAGIPIRVGTGRRWWGLLLYTHHKWETRHRGNMHECTRSRHHGRVLLEALGADSSVCDRPPRTGLTVSAQACVEALNWFEQFNLKRPVILHVGAGSAVDWPLAHMAQLADRLTDRGVPVLISTGYGRPDLEQAMKDACSRSHVFTPGKPTTEQLTALLKEAACVVAVSTGPPHLARVLDTPTVGLFPCLKDALPDQWGPMGNRAINLVAPEPPGGMYRCRQLADPAHMQALSVDSVMEAVLRQIGV